MMSFPPLYILVEFSHFLLYVFAVLNLIAIFKRARRADSLFMLYVFVVYNVFVSA